MQEYLLIINSNTMTVNMLRTNEGIECFYASLITITNENKLLHIIARATMKYMSKYKIIEYKNITKKFKILLTHFLIKSKPD